MKWGIDMNKILIELYVPLIEKKFDVFIPTNRNLNRILKLLKKGINDLSDNSYPVNYEPILCDGETGVIYKLDKTIKEQNIKNGTKMVLI